MAANLNYWLANLPADIPFTGLSCYLGVPGIDGHGTLFEGFGGCGVRGRIGLRVAWAAPRYR